MAIDFPRDFIEDLVEDNIKSGNVIRVFCDDLKGESKDKMLVIVSKSTCATMIGCILINSDNYPNINNTYYLKSLQLPAESQKYRGFLNRDSFFDCSEIKIRNINEISTILSADVSRLLGKVDAYDHKAICDALKNNKTISNKTKKLFYLV